MRINLKKLFMKERKEKKIDPSLDTPSEANRQKHINFLDVENDVEQEQNRRENDEFSEERQKQWKEGIAEGKEAREKNANR
jgi:hypothetical protein